MGGTSEVADNGEGPQESLSDLLRYWRARAAPRRTAGRVQSRRGPGLSQKEVAQLTGVTERWYGELERGRHANYSTSFLDGLASALQLSDSERRTLYLRAIGRSPALQSSTPDTYELSIFEDSMGRLLDIQHPNPAFLTDRAWTILGYNQAQQDWFPWVLEEPNVMRWAFLHREDREQLVDWREWAGLFLALLRFARAENPENQVLQQLERDVLAGNPEAREIWNWHEVREHTSGVECRLRVPYHQGEEVAVRILVLAPLLNPQLRFIVLMKID